MRRPLPKLQTLITVTVLGMSFLSMGIAVCLNYFNNLTNLTRHTQELVLNIGETLQTRLAEKLALNEYDLAAVHKEIAEASLTNHMKAILLTDDNDKVLSGSRFEWRGQAPGDSLHYQAYIAAEVRGGHRDRIVYDSNTAMLNGYFPVMLNLKAGEIRPSRRGVLFVRYDISDLNALVWQSTSMSALVYVAGTLLLTITLLAIFRLRVVRPVLAIAQAAGDYSRGNRMVRTGLHGSGEVNEVGRMFDGMLDQISCHEQLLRDSENHFRTMSESLPEQVWTAFPDGSLDYVNQRVTEFFGRSFEAMIGEGWQDRVHPDDLSGCIATWTRSLQTGEPYEADFRLLHRSGSYRWCIARALALRDEEGNIVKWYGSNTDITDRKQAEIKLKRSEEFLRISQTAGGIGTWEADLQNNRQTWSDSVKSILGFPGYANPSWEDFLAAVHPDDRALVIQATQDHLDQGAKYQVEYRIFDSRQQIRWMCSTGSCERDKEGKPLFMRGVVQDITDRKQSEEKLRLTARIFETTLEGIMITDADCNLIDVNAAFTESTGYSRDEVLGKNPRILKSGHQDAAFYAEMWRNINSAGHWSGEIWNRRKSGEVYPEWITISTITNRKGEATHYVGIASDITLLKQHEKQLEHIAHYDALTGIPNRVLLIDRMKQAMAQTLRDQTFLAICYLDLDGFKPINDCFGHDAGDRVLIEIAKRIELTIRGGDTVARMGGDEFVVLLMGLESIEEYHSTLERLLAVIAEPIACNDQQFIVTSSIGVTFYPEDNEDADTLLRHADQAMYLSKQTGKNCYHSFDPVQDAYVKARHEEIARIEQALNNQELLLFYQPKVAMDSLHVVGTEALIRWQHPQRGLLSPLDFLPAIENTDMEITVGNWVIETALAQIVAWQAQGLDIEVSINLSAAHLQSEGFIQGLRSKLSCYPTVQANHVQIEILESAALGDISETAGLIEACSRLGVSFALDDFGTGYSSLSYLRRLPAKTLKIDQTFVRDMLTDEGDRAIVQGIIALAKTFKRETVAEGVETQRHFDELNSMGCDIAQGYGIARPMPGSEFIVWRRNWNERYRPGVKSDEVR